MSTTRDFSRGGLFIHTAVAKPPGERLVVRLELGAACVELEGTVVHRDVQGMGVRLDLACARVVDALRSAGRG